jgi:hypothetical protein
VLRRLFESQFLISSAVENAQDLCPAARPAVVGEVFAGWKTVHPGGDIIRRSAGIRMFAQQPEPVSDAVDEPVGCIEACPLNSKRKISSRSDSASLETR